MAEFSGCGNHATVEPHSTSESTSVENSNTKFKADELISNFNKSSDCDENEKSQSDALKPSRILNAYGSPKRLMQWRREAQISENVIAAPAITCTHHSTAVGAASGAVKVTTATLKPSGTVFYELSPSRHNRAFQSDSSLQILNRTLRPGSADTLLVKNMFSITDESEPGPTETA